MNTMAFIFDTMERRGVRQQWLADQLAVDKSLLTKYKKGSRRAPAGIVLRSAALLSLDVPVAVARQLASTDADIFDTPVNAEPANAA